MNKSKLNIVIDAVAFAGFVLLTTTGVLVRYVLPPGSGRFSKVFGLDRHGWGDIHFWIAVAFFATLTVHLVLHWKWIVSVVKGRKAEGSHGWRVGLAIVALVALVAISAAPFVAPIEQTGAAGVPGALGTEPDNFIRGSLTLREAAATVGVPVEQLISRLGLPKDIDPDERLGRLSRSHGISIAKVRQILDE